MSSRGWFTVPGQKDIEKRRKEQRRARAAAEQGEDVEAVLRQDQRERERQAMREEAARIEAAEKQKRDAHAKEQRKQAEAAARQRKAEAVERTRRAKDPTTWQVVTDRLADRSDALCAALHKLFDEGEYGAHVAANPGARIEYAMALADAECSQTTAPTGSSAPQREPLLSFLALCGKHEGAARLKAALNAQVQAKPLGVADLLHACAALFGPKGNKVLKYEQGRGLGARLVLQYVLTVCATDVAANLDAFTTLFFKGAAGDKSSAALGNLVFVLDQVTGAAESAALRNALVAVANNAAGLDVPPAVLAKLQPWFEGVTTRLDDAKPASPKSPNSPTGKPLLFTPAAAALVVAALGADVAPDVIVRAGVLWNEKAGTHLIGSLLKRVAAPSDAAAATVVAMIRADASLASQLATSMTSAPAQVNAVLATCQAEGVALPRDVATNVREKAATALSGKGKASSVDDYAATSKLLKGVKAGRNVSAGGSSCGCLKWLVAIGVAGAAAGAAALHLGGPDAQRQFAVVAGEVRQQLQTLAARVASQ